MKVNGIVLAGGRSTRLGGVPKAGLTFDGTTLLEHAVNAAEAVGARHVVVVGELPSALRGRHPALLSAREDPPFGGPAAALGAGLSALERAGGASDVVLVLSCDLPHAETAARALVDSIDLLENADALLALDEDGHPQQLTALYRAPELSRAIAHARTESGSLTDLPVRAVLHGLRTASVVTPGTGDLDTWEDAAHFGIEDPRIGAHSTGGPHE